MKVTTPGVMALVAACMCIYNAVVLLDGAQAVAWVAVAVAFCTQHSSIVVEHQIKEAMNNLAKAGMGLESAVKKSFGKVANNMRTLDGKVSKVQQKWEQDRADS